jgi:hypothetical protein
VNKASKATCAAKVYVKPGDAAGSQLYIKVQAGQNYGCGGVMPPGGAISKTDADLLKSWIDGGALK